MKPILVSLQWMTQPLNVPCDCSFPPCRCFQPLLTGRRTQENIWWRVCTRMSLTVDQIHWCPSISPLLIIWTLYFDDTFTVNEYINHLKCNNGFDILHQIEDTTTFLGEDINGYSIVIIVIRQNRTLSAAMYASVGITWVHFYVRICREKYINGKSIDRIQMHAERAHYEMYWRKCFVSYMCI